MAAPFKIVALIMCRGGSKGIPGKNIKTFADKPLLAWALDAARDAGVFDQVILSTDSTEIAAVGEAHGAMVPGLRPAHLATDTSDQFDTQAYMFERLGISDATHRVCILTNNPFIDVEVIRDGYRASEKVEFRRVVLDTVRVGGDYVYWRQTFEYRARMRYHFAKAMLDSEINRQTTAPSFVPINNTRWGWPSVFNSYDAYKHEIVTNGFVPIWLPKIKNFDLDDREDWEIAEAVFLALRQRPVSPASN